MKIEKQHLGKRVVWDGDEAAPVIVTAVGEFKFLAKNTRDGEESEYFRDGKWILRGDANENIKRPSERIWEIFRDRMGGGKRKECDSDALSYSILAYLDELAESK